MRIVRGVFAPGPLTNIFHMREDYSWVRLNLLVWVKIGQLLRRSGVGVDVDVSDLSAQIRPTQEFDAATMEP